MEKAFKEVMETFGYLPKAESSRVQEKKAEIEGEKQRHIKEATLREQAENKLKETEQELQILATEIEEKRSDIIKEEKLLKEAQNRIDHSISENEEIAKKKEQELVKLKNSLKELKTDIENLKENHKRKEKDLKSTHTREKRTLRKSIEEDESELNKIRVLETVYMEFRRWFEDQASNSYGWVHFEEFIPSEIDYAIKMNTRFLGVGGYGSVYEAVIKDRRVAIKVLKEQSKQGDREFRQEVEILRRIRHQNLVTLVGACGDKHALVYEFCPNGTLQDRLSEERRGSFSWQERVKVAASICSALVFLHNTKPDPIAHGDLKPDNILFDSENLCKLSDFGISRFLMSTTETTTPHHTTDKPKGSLYYMDPQLTHTGKLTPQSDLFSLGIILLQLVTGRGPGYGNNGLREHVLDEWEHLKNVETNPSHDQLLALIHDDKLNLDEMSRQQAAKMVDLGLKCSEPTRQKRPKQATQVWAEVMAIVDCIP